MRDQPTPEQTPERIAEQLAAIRAAHRDGMSGDDCSDFYVPGSCDLCATLSAAIAQLAALTATLAHLTQERDELRQQIFAAIEEMPACRRQHLLGAPLLAIVQETVRQMFWQQSRAEQAEAALARVKALGPQWREEVKDRAGAGCGCYGKSAMQRACAEQLDAALVDPPVASSTETKT